MDILFWLYAFASFLAFVAPVFPRDSVHSSLVLALPCKFLLSRPDLDSIGFVEPFIEDARAQ